MKRRKQELSPAQCWAALDLEQGASLDDIKRAYRRRAFELHPDLNPDNPRANYEFQILNEAYVILSKLSDSQEQTDKTSKQEKDAKAEHGAAKNGNARRETPPTGKPQPDAEREETRNRQETRQERAAHAAYAKEEDVLRDLLNDPFARRVFEDIYAQMRHQEHFSPPPPSSSPPPPNTGKNKLILNRAEADWSAIKNGADLSQGIGKAVKGWVRSQIDDRQTVQLAASMLVPGARIRLQIRRGIRDDLSTVEITLPKDYVAGKPVRLKGMGRHIGPWQGDLYLTLLPKE